MLYPERMRKLFIIGPKKQLPTVVNTLHRTKNAHIIEHKRGEYDIGDPLPELEHISSLLVQVRSLLSYTQPLSSDILRTEMTMKEIEQQMEKISPSFKEVIEKKKQNQDSNQTLTLQKQLLDSITPLHLSPEDFSPASSYSHFLGTLPNDSVISKLKKITSKLLVKGANGKDTLTIALFIEKGKAQEAEQLLVSAGFSPIDTAPLLGLEGTNSQVRQHLTQQLHTLQQAQKEHDHTLQQLKNKHQAFLFNAEKILHAESEKAQAPLKFGSTKETFFLSAYLPSIEVQETKKKLMQETKQHLYITEQRIKEGEDIPIKLNNPAYVKPFEFFTNLYALPNYKEFDPTWLIAFTFPLFAGFMLGDVAYGLIMVLLFLWLKKKFPVGKEFFTIMIYAGISAMVFGGLYGEILGFEPWSSHHGGHGDHAAPDEDKIYPFVERTVDFNALMIIALLTGIIHVNFGLLLGVFLEWKNHGPWHATTHRLSWIILQLSFVLLYLAYAQGTIHLAIAWGVFALATFLIYKAEGFIGVLEMPTIISHLLSYARLMAVGLASVFIAVMVNQLATYLYGLSLWWLPLVIVVMIVGHTFAVALGILSPSLHSIRLHYVEFFTKFYQGGGKEYAPFGAEQKPSLL